MRLLLVEDDPLLGDGTKVGLEFDGYSVDWVTTVKDAKEAVSTHHYDLTVLDLGLPDASGLEVLKTMRKRNINTPVLILTARDSTSDMVQGLDTGADDYLVKPFKLEELCARLRALHRRTSQRAEPTIKVANVELDPAAHSVNIDGQEIAISRREFSLLQKLLENVGKVQSREKLTQSLYGWGDDVDSNALEVHIHNLRKKFSEAINIRTIRGVGYLVEKPGGETDEFDEDF